MTPLFKGEACGPIRRDNILNACHADAVGGEVMMVSRGS